MSIGISELLGVERMTVEQADFSKTLTIAPLEKISSSRRYIHNRYMYPVTFQMYACGGTIFGMNVKVYNCESPDDDMNGQFFTVLNTYPTGMHIALKKRKNYNPTEYKSMYGIIRILEHRGYDIMFNRSIKWTGEGAPSIHKLSLSKDFQPQISTASTTVALADIVTN